MKRLWFCLATLVMLLLPGCSSDERAKPADDKIQIVVSILPQAYFAERIGGSHVAVEALVKPGQSPHTYEPTPRQVAQLGKADLYFTIGVPFEKALLQKIRGSLPNLHIADTQQGIRLRLMTESEVHAEEAQHEQSGHSHHAGEPDPHTWLDPRLVKIQARNMAEALKQVDPSHAAEYDSNLNAFGSDLEKLDQHIREKLGPLRGKPFYVFHPAFGYFADAYGLKQVPIETEGKEPGGRQLAEMIDQARHENVRVIFVQAQFSPKSANAVAQSIGAKVVPLDDLPRDYMANMEDMAEKIAEALAPR